jgi:uncharacterized protein YjiS (DUF1127 family)
MGTIQLTPGSIRFSTGNFPAGSERSGQQTDTPHFKADTEFGKMRRNRKMSVLGIVWSVLIRWNRHCRMRHELLMMDAHQLRDIGITAQQAQKEANKSFWRLFP